MERHRPWKMSGLCSDVTLLARPPLTSLFIWPSAKTHNIKSHSFITISFLAYYKYPFSVAYLFTFSTVTFYEISVVPISLPLESG